MFGKTKNKKEQIIEAAPIKTENKLKKALKNTLFWILSICLIIFGLAFIPSITSGLFFLATVLILPVGKLQNGLKKIFPKKALKGCLCTVLVFVAIITGSTDSKRINTHNNGTPKPTIVQQTKETEKPERQQPAAAEEAPAETQKPAEEAPAETQKPTEEAPAETTVPVEEQIHENSTFEIHYIDVGQADAALVLCDGQAMLIDGGNSEDSSLIYSYLKNRNISHLDYIVATHGHEDHVGGLSGALNYATVGTVYCSVSSYDNEAFADFVKYLDKQDKGITVPEAGDSFKLGSALVQIIAVNENSIDHNDTSIMLRIVYGDTSFLFTGDAEREAEQVALDSDCELKSTVLKIGHHGSENSTEYVFLRQVEPQYAVISVGKDNTYGHPAEDVLSRLRDADVETYRTDLQGTIICVSDGKTLSFTVSKNANADTLAPQKQEMEEPVEQTTPPIAVTQAPVDEENVGTDYIGNKNSKVFHYPSCSSVKQMKESNKFYFTGTRDEMIDMGYKSCGNCHP